VEPNNAEGSPAGYYISFNTNGSSTTVENEISNYQWNYQNGIESDGTNTILAPGAYIEKTSTGAFYGISVEDFQVSTDDYVNDKMGVLENVFDVGSRTYTLENELVFGAAFSALINGDVWSTVLGVQPTSSYFNITESIDAGSNFYQIGREVKGTFSCKLFNQSGSVKTLTNGSFHLLFVLD
jgi:hypothetical protein